ncbi:MAG TPA: hypothetical protein VMJ10_29065 [Kofleriaceae bacterium]|nr:hypothetical protein [Kofleriaceae bacterium]
MFHVFVEGAKDGSPAGLDRLAKAMAAHYGLQPADLLARLQSGRFRAKGNCDRATAEQYVRDLERLGARCTIEPVAGAPAPPARASTPSLQPATKAPAPAPVAAKAGPAQFSSGLSAAFSTDSAQADVGAFAKLESGALSLASVDGSGGTDEAVAAEAFAPPPAVAAAPAKPEAKPAAAKSAKPARPKDEPLDLFVPPDAGGDFKVELADDEVERSAKKRASTPPPNEPAAEPAPAVARTRSQLSLAPATDSAPAAPRGNPLGDERVRLVAGVVLAILIGFVPAHFVAAVREKSAYAAVDREVETAQSDAQTMDTYDALDARRAELLARKYDERRSIAITALLIWAAAGAGIAYVWFKRVPWDRVSNA